MSLDFDGCQKVVIGLSGGIDSYVCAYAAARQGVKITGFHANTARPVAPMEKAASKMLSFSMAFYLEHANLQPLSAIQAGYLPAEVIAAGEWDAIEEFDHTVPVTGYSVLLSTMAYYAHISGHDGLVVGLTKEQTVARDAATGFQAFESMLSAFNPKAKKLKIVAPLLGLEKHEIIQEGQSLGVPFEQSWSCICLVPNTHTHCGVCQGCQDRKAGFAKAGVVDPTKYLA